MKRKEMAVDGITYGGRFKASLACSFFTCAMIVDGSALLRYVRYGLDWYHEPDATCAAILVAVCFILFAGRVFGTRFRRAILERRALLSWVFGVSSVVGHGAALAVQGLYDANAAIVMAVCVIATLLLIVPTVLSAGLAASLAWGSSELYDALCFPCVMLLGLFIGDSLHAPDASISLASSILGAVLLVIEAAGDNECFCAWTRPLSYGLITFMIDANHKAMQAKWGIAGMIGVSSIAVGTQVIEVSWPMAVVILVLLVFYYNGDVAARCAGGGVVLFACLVTWLEIPNAHEACVMTMLASFGALACFECGPRGLLLSAGCMFAAVGLSEALHGSVRYLVLADVSSIAILLLIPCALFVCACRPSRRVMSMWTLTRRRSGDP